MSGPALALRLQENNALNVNISGEIVQEVLINIFTTMMIRLSFLSNFRWTQISFIDASHFSHCAEVF